MLTYPEIDPVALSLGPVQIHWYGLMYLLGFLCAYALGVSRAKRIGWTSEQVSDLIFYGAVGVVIGGRLGYVFFYGFDRLAHDPLWAFRVWEGGMSFHGGLLGVMAAMMLFAKQYKVKWFDVTDFIVPIAIPGLFFGRIGNFIGGELWGRPVQNPDFPLAMIFPHVDELARHPSQLYQAFGEGLLLFIVLWLFTIKPQPRMAASGLFLIGYGIARFINEFFREPDSDQGFVFFEWMTKGQMLTTPMIVLGLVLIVLAYRRPVVNGVR
jgi:phosphatidylglycerol:prolipoprotein diacylglycerol transferase